MARTRRVVAERESTPVPGDLGADLAAQAAKVFAADAQSTVPPRPAGQSIHVAIVHMGEHGASAIDARDASFICSQKPEGKRTVVVAPLDDSRFCPKCLQARPHAVGSSVRVVTVLVSP